MMRIALAGNPNAGKTTLFNALTGSNQFVGNWPGCTVEKKEGRLKGFDAVIVDLPGIYSLSPYSPEEVVSREYLVRERPDAILNIVDGTNLERNLYLTTQLAELGIPMVVAVNMADVLKKNGDKINIEQMSKALGCPVVAVSALKGDGCANAAQTAVALAAGKKPMACRHRFTDCVEHALARIEETVLYNLPENHRRWYSVKVFEGDKKVIKSLDVPAEVLERIQADIKSCEDEMDDDAESIITAERYEYIGQVIGGCVARKSRKNLSVSDRIDRIVTNRFLALPIFALAMFLVYFVSITTVGAWCTDWVNDGLFGDGYFLLGAGRQAYEDALADFEASAADEPDPADYGRWIPGIPALVERGLDAVNCAEFLKSLVLDGIIAGVGAVLGFVPQMLVLFFFLAFLESCGYMARVAFIMDRIFRRFGLSGKSFIPMLIGTGCAVPAVMASRTIENERDRRITIMTTTFIPCGAKLPIIALISSSLFDGSAWVAASAYFVGVAAIICSGIILKKTRPFLGDAAPFVMELPAYRWPAAKNILRSVWERGWSFIKKAGTIILLSSVVIWAGSVFGITGDGFGFDPDLELESSVLGFLGNAIRWIFVPLGFGNIRAVIATVMGLVAKEEVVGVFGVLDFVDLSRLAGYAFLVFNLLCAPCFAAIGAIRREMGSAKWTWAAIGWQCAFAYAVSLCIYQIGSLFAGRAHAAGLIFALAVLACFVWLLVRKPKSAAEVL